METSSLKQNKRSLMTGSRLKSTLLILTVGFLSLTTFANSPLISKQQLGMFKNSKTCVVLQGVFSPIDVALKSAVEKYWNCTEYEFIDTQEFEKRKNNSKYSFLLQIQGVFDDDPEGIGYSYLSLVLGGSVPNITDMPEICSIPFAYSEEENINYNYAVPSIVKFIQKHAKNLETKRFIIWIRGLNYYNWSSNFKKKVLLLNSATMAPDANSPDKIDSSFDSYVKLQTAAEIAAILDENPTNTLFNFHVGPSANSAAGKCFEMIFDVEGNLYYYHSRKVTNKNKDGFNQRDFSRL